MALGFHIFITRVLPLILYNNFLNHTKYGLHGDHGRSCKREWSHRRLRSVGVDPHPVLSHRRLRSVDVEPRAPCGANRRLRSVGLDPREGMHETTVGVHAGVEPLETTVGQCRTSRELSHWRLRSVSVEPLTSVSSHRRLRSVGVEPRGEAHAE